MALKAENHKMYLFTAGRGHENDEYPEGWGHVLRTASKQKYLAKIASHNFKNKLLWVRVDYGDGLNEGIYDNMKDALLAGNAFTE